MAYNHGVEGFRDSEYPMMKDKVYLDHGGTTIYAKSLIEDFSKDMIANLYGNPHSHSDPAKLSGHMVDSIRLKALSFFNADPEHFDLVFTSNATAAIKLVGESFRDLASSNPRSPSFWYGYHKDAHTSIVGVRELAGGDHYCFNNDEEVEHWLSGQAGASGAYQNKAGLPGLFAYPGQSNLTGRRLPLGWIKKLRDSKALSHQNTYSLLDAAALATTAELDLSRPDSAPDFTAISFYKIFGFPDLGALIVRKDSGHILEWRKYFGGGTVNGLTVLHEATVLRKKEHLHDALEDGTLPFHNIIALGCAIDVHKKLYGNDCMKKISQHTSYLGYRLHQSMISLAHFNGAPLCVVHHDPGESTYGDSITQGATIAFSIMRSDGTYVGHSVVEKQANDKGIYLRSGGMCNAGGIATYLEIEPWQFKRAWSSGYRCGEADIELINGKPTGAVRASLGAMSTIADVRAFVAFLEDEFLEAPGEQVDFARNGSMGSRGHGHGANRSNDSGFSSAAASVIHSSLPVHINARRMMSSPNLRALRQAEPGFYAQRTFNGNKPDTASSNVSLASLRSQHTQHTQSTHSSHGDGGKSQAARSPQVSYVQRPTTARTMESVERAIDLRTRKYDQQFDQVPLPHLEHNLGKHNERNALKFWKPRKSSKPLLSRDDDQ